MVKEALIRYLKECNVQFNSVELGSKGLLQLFNNVRQSEVGKRGSLFSVLQAFFNCGIQYNRSGEHRNAVKCYKKCLDLCDKDSRNYSSICCGIGNTYHSLKMYKKAVKYHTKDLKTCEALNDLSGLAKAYCNLGNAYDSLKLYKKAIQSHSMYLKICKQIGNLEGEGGACGNLGVMYHKLGEHEKALEMHKMHLRIAKKAGDSKGEFTALCNIGTAYHELGLLDQAMFYRCKELNI